MNRMQNISTNNKSHGQPISYKSYIGVDLLEAKCVKKGLLMFNKLNLQPEIKEISIFNDLHPDKIKASRSLLSVLTCMSSEAGANNKAFDSLTLQEINKLNACLKNIGASHCAVFRILKDNSAVTLMLNVNQFKKTVDAFPKHFSQKITSIEFKDAYNYGTRLVNSIDEWYKNYLERNKNPILTTRYGLLSGYPLHAAMLFLEKDDHEHQQVELPFGGYIGFNKKWDSKFAGRRKDLVKKSLLTLGTKAKKFDSMIQHLKTFASLA